MKIVELIRLEENYEHGTFGILRINKCLFCCTLEPKDERNAPFISSIPAQQYNCVKVNSTKFGVTYMVNHVPGRSNILFHSGNTDNDTEGCILLGETFGKLGYNRGILNSGNTFKKFLNELENSNGFHLTIKELY